MGGIYEDNKINQNKQEFSQTKESKYKNRGTNSDSSVPVWNIIHII